MPCSGLFSFSEWVGSFEPFERVLPTADLTLSTRPDIFVCVVSGSKKCSGCSGVRYVGKSGRARATGAFYKNDGMCLRGVPIGFNDTSYFGRFQSPSSKNHVIDVCTPFAQQMTVGQTMTSDLELKAPALAPAGPAMCRAVL